MRGYLRKRDFFVIFQNLGTVMEGVGAVVLIPLMVALIYNEQTYLGFLVPALISLSIGYILKRFSGEGTNLRLKHECPHPELLVKGE